MAFLCVFDGRHIRIVCYLPNGLQDQCFLVCEDVLLHFLRTAAIRWAGVVCAILAAKIFFAVRTERWIEDNLPGIHNCRCREPLIDCTLNHFFFCHSNHPVFNILTGQRDCQEVWSSLQSFALAVLCCVLYQDSGSNHPEGTDLQWITSPAAECLNGGIVHTTAAPGIRVQSGFKDSTKDGRTDLRPVEILTSLTQQQINAAPKIPTVFPLLVGGSTVGIFCVIGYADVRE